MIWKILKDGGLEGGEKIEYYKLPKRFKLLVTHSDAVLSIMISRIRYTMIVHEFVNFLLMAKFHSEHPSSRPQTSPDYVLSSWLRNSFFFVFIGEV